MSNKNLFKEAIADAKAVREAALANAKAALEEALTPKLHSMLNAKLNEMAEEEGVYEEKVEEDYYMEEENTDPALEEDFDLSEILAELEAENLNEAEEEEEEGEEEGAEEEEASEEMNIANMSVEDLKDLIKDIVSQEIEAEEEETEADEAGEEMEMDNIDMDNMEMASMEEEINLDELLAELDALDEGEVELEEAKKATFTVPANDADDLDDEAKYFKSLLKKAKIDATVKAGIGELEITVDPSVKAKAKKAVEDAGYSLDEAKEKEEMKEAIETINTLRAELNEVNLLNAKLLYVNKIFKAKNLTESQKVKVIASFDNATTPKEAKVVYESLSAALTSKGTTKQTIKENLGFASKATGVAPKQTIVESNDIIARMQKLANIKN